MYEKKRFHPIALINYILNTLKSFFILILLVIANIPSEPLWSIIILVGILALSVILSFFKYFSRRYSVKEDKIVVYSGLFVKKETEITYERIQTIKQRQWFFYKPFNVVQILIETGSTSSEEAEASLLAVDTSLIDVIEDNRHRRSSSRNTSLHKDLYNDLDLINDYNMNFDYTDKEDNYEVENEIFYEYSMSNTDILFYALTDLNILIVLLPFIAFLFEIFTEFPDVLDYIPQAVTSGLDDFLTQAIWFIILISIISSIGILLAISTIKNFLYYFDFRVTSSRKTITIEYGLFERKTQKIPLNKVQGIKTYQQVLRKAMGMASVEIIIIGGQENKGESALEDKVLILPLIKTNLMGQALQDIFPNYHMEEPEINYVGRGKLFYFWRWILVIFIPLIIVVFYFIKWLGLILLFVAAILLLFNWLDFRYQGYAIMGENLISIQNFSGFSKVQTFLDHSKIQAFKKHSSYFLLRRNIGHFVFFIKSGVTSTEVGLKFTDKEHIDEIQKFYVK